MRSLLIIQEHCVPVAGCVIEACHGWLIDTLLRTSSEQISWRSTDITSLGTWLRRQKAVVDWLKDRKLTQHQKAAPAHPIESPMRLNLKRPRSPTCSSCEDRTPFRNGSLAARVLTELVRLGCFAEAGGPDDTSGSNKLIACLGELGSHALELLEVSNAVAASGNVAAMQKLCSQQTQLTCAASTCAAAARAGSIPMLQLLTSQHVSCPWDSDLYEEASRGGHVTFLEYLRDEDYQWTQECYLQCLRAAHDAGQEGVISWLFSQAPPGKWTQASCLQASHCGIAALLPWLATSCPFKWTQQHCHSAALMKPPALFCQLDRGGPTKPWKTWHASDLIDRASRGEYNVGHLATDLVGMPELCVAAASRGQLDMLKWLFQQRRQRNRFCQVLQAALEADQAHILQYLMDIGLTPSSPNLYRAGPRCLLLWAKTGHSMRDSYGYQLTALVESWYVFMGLVKWAASPRLPWSAKKKKFTRPTRSTGIARKSPAHLLLKQMSTLARWGLDEDCS